MVDATDHVTGSTHAAGVPQTDAMVYQRHAGSARSLSVLELPGGPNFEKIFVGLDRHNNRHNPGHS